MIFAAEEALRDTKMQIKSLKREARLAQSIEEQKQNQKSLSSRTAAEAPTYGNF